MRFVQNRAGLLVPDRSVPRYRSPKYQRGFLGSGIAFFSKRASGGDPTLRGTFAKWNMEDASGSTTATDSSGNGHNITLVSGTNCTFGNQSILPNGSGSSIKLPKTSTIVDYLPIPGGFITELTRPFSIVTFLRLLSIPTNNGGEVFCSPSGGINWYINSSGKMVAGIAGITNNAADTRILAALTNYMLGVTCSATGDVTFYVNKTAGSVTSGAFPSSATGTDTARIGNYPNDPTQTTLQALLQRYALCNVELSATEMAAYYDALS